MTEDGKQMISIASETESLVMQESVDETDYGDMAPRISRTATLDGGCVVSTHGFSHADRTMVVNCKNVSAASETVLKRITGQALPIVLANREGVFTGFIDRLACKAGEISFIFLVTEKITPD